MSNDFFQSLRFAPCLTGPNDLGAMCTDPTKSKTGSLRSISERFFDLELSRELIPPITAFLEEDLKLVHTGGNLTPGDGVGSRRSFRTPTQKLTVVKPRCYLVKRLTSRIWPNKTTEKSHFKIFVSR